MYMHTDNTRYLITYLNNILFLKIYCLLRPLSSIFQVAAQGGGPPNEGPPEPSYPQLYTPNASVKDRASFRRSSVAKSPLTKKNSTSNTPTKETPPADLYSLLKRDGSTVQSVVQGRRKAPRPRSSKTLSSTNSKSDISARLPLVFKQITHS